MKKKRYKTDEATGLKIPVVSEEIRQWYKDEEQEKVIKHKNGPLLVVAGAGTGKTRVITQRIAYLINEKIVEPSQILALTFSEKAADEMEKRVYELVPYGMIDTHISTFHSFGHSIINDSFADLRIAPDWKLITDIDAVILVVQNIDRFNLKIYKPLNNPAKYIKEILDFISKLKDNLIKPNIYIRYAEDLLKNAKNDVEKELAEKHIELSHFYETYETLKLEKNLLDYGDLIMVPYYLFLEKKSVLSKYQEKFRYILIDEFQDTNYAQFEFIKLIADKYRNITAVGDDDQMIYRFRGAAISNIMNFKEYYKDAEVVVLKTNYRSTQMILDAAYKLIQNNNDRLEKKLGVKKKLESRYKQSHRLKPININIFSNYSEEADFIANEIEHLIKEKKYTLKDFAVLVRAKNDAKMFLKTFERRGIKYIFTGDEGLYNKKEVQFFINFCRMLAMPYEFNPLFDVAISPYYNIDPFLMSKLMNKARDYSIPVYDLLKRIDLYNEIVIEDKERKKVNQLVADIEYYSKLVAKDFSAGEILFEFINKKKIFENLMKENSPEADQKIINISKFFEIVKNFSINEDYDTLYNFVNYIDLRQKAGDKPLSDTFQNIDEDAVWVSTIHKAKGLEFPVVFIVALIQDKFPGKTRALSSLPLPEQIMHDLVDEETYQKEEERRLFYVAMTRAKDALYLSASRQYEGAGDKKISIFLNEIGFNEPEEKIIKTQKPEEKIKYFEKKEQILSDIRLNLDNIVLSNYQIDDYITCPFKYKLIHILRLPIREQPEVIYGQAMHKVVSEYFKARQEGRDLSLDELKNIFISLWKPIGFISRQHEKVRFEKGLENIQRFYLKEKENKIIPKYIEKSFDFKLTENLTITGRWDRIDEIDGKSIIIDYKTSDVISYEDAKKKIDSPNVFNQLKLYAIAYEKIFGRPVDEVGVYFLESTILVTKKIRKDVLERYVEKIFEVAEEIKKGNFDATPETHICSMCAFNNICPFSKADVLF
ncbi:MAG: ATP-dependent helicase [Candidatus Goldbacteria bacterium]|nr:ATP-dependent helicase [Candidatus Goldiibacteriota bacterium]